MHLIAGITDRVAKKKGDSKFARRFNLKIEGRQF